MNTKITLKWMLSAVLVAVVGGFSFAQIQDQTSFEELSDGTKVRDSEWSSLGFDKTDGNEDRFEIDDAESKSGSKSLKVTYPKNVAGVNKSGGQDVLKMTARDEYYLSYWVKFDPDFDWGDPSKNVGGKLPGLSGGSSDANAGCSGGENCNGSNGFSVRYMWRKDGKAILYVYDMDKPGAYPTDLPLRKSNGNQIKFQKGEWIHLVMRVKINTGNNKNGEIEVWVNNERVFGPEDKKFRFVNNGDKVEKFLFSTFHGGSSSSWAPRRNNTAWFDDILITTSQDDIFNTADGDNDGVPDVIDGCPTDPAKTAPGICGCFVSESACSFEEQFDDGDLSNSVRGETTLTLITAEETACGELKVTDGGSAGSLGNFDPLFVDILNPTDMSENPVVEIRVRSTEPVKVRIDIRDVNDNKTSGPAGKVEKQVKGDPLLWQVLRFEYPLAAFTEKNVDITKVKTFDIMFDAGSPGFDGDIYFDYIAIGKGLGNANSTCIDGAGTPDCLGQPGGDAYIDDCNECVGGESPLVDCSASTLFENQFDDQTVDITGNAYSQDGLIILEETGCGELKLVDNGLGTFSVIFLNFPTPLDVSSNSKIVLRARATDDVKIRLDFRQPGSASSKRNSANTGGDIRLDIAGNPDAWAQYVYDFPASSFENSDPAKDMDPTQITQVGITINPGIAGFNGTLWFDYIAIGDASGIGDSDDATICPEIGKDCNGVTGGSAIFDTQCETCVGGNTGVALDWCVTSVGDAFEEGGVSLFPNPTSTTIQLSEAAAWELLSVQQQELTSGEGVSIDLSSYDSGVYFVRIDNIMHRVIKE